MTTKTAESLSSISQALRSLGANAYARSPICVHSDDDEKEQNRAAWRDLIDGKLLEWGRDPSQLRDEGVEPPTAVIIHTAITLASRWSDEGFAAPHSIVPDPNGGIVFEWRKQDLTGVCHLWDDGTVEVRLFRGTRLIDRAEL